MVLINGRKFACEACIRGHRASNCSHTGRRLQLIRKKGRPSSQCDLCRTKRASGNFHGRCDCLEDESLQDSNRIRKQDEKSEKGIETFTPFLIDQETPFGNLDGESTSQSKHSIQSLMNPCQCRTTGICNCCSRASSSKDGMQAVVKTASVDQPASCGCNGDNQCCDDGIESVQCSPLIAANINLPAIQPSCCGGNTKSRTTQSSHLAPLLDSIPSSLPMTTEEADAILAPDCHCGPDCTCPGCLMENENARKNRKKGNEECPDKCLTCSACVLGLTRPSGIEAVDAWMEQDKQKMIETEDFEEAAINELNTNGNTTHALPPSTEHSLPSNVKESEIEASDSREQFSPSQSTVEKSSPRVSEPFVQSKKVSFVQPPLPPFPSAKKYYEDHFLNPERRRFFADHIQKQSLNRQNEDKVTPANQEKSREVDFGERYNGETDEEWQMRYGFRFLTPDAIKIFDHAKRFREEKMRIEEEEEMNLKKAEEDRVLSKEKRQGELLLLRQRALSARKKPKTTVC